MAASVRMNKLKETIQVKKKFIYVNNSLHLYCCNEEDEENYSGKLFQPVRFRDYWNLEDVHMR